MPTDRLAAARSISASSRALVGLAAQSLEQAPVEVTLSQWRVLVLVHTRGEQGMSALAADLGLSRSSITRLIERLERKDLVARVPSTSSRREVRVRLEPAGTELVVGVLEIRLRQIERVLEGVPSARLGALESAFALFAAAAGEPLDLEPPATAPLTERS